ncbi:polysaccharide biosynthesis/export family protein [Sphingomonas flavalba]|uniref:polysaccharide biosynthesis/export family protein n=1 Tax=Sphingomonas flavalba TaxID=2559804 RepID=UPI001EF03841|nr:polysaccharide biosynthesis/export family protein [Sphingomonas flavalba]
MISRFLKLSFAAPLALAGCATGPALVGGPAVQVLDTTELPAPKYVGTDGEKVYLIGPLDKISVTVLGLEELSSKEIQVDAGGRVAIPLAGAIDAGGKTPSQVSALIEDKLRTYVRNPQVAVNIVDYASNVITVDGQVREPGIYPVIGEMTLMRAVASAKGAGEFAKLREVVLFRKVEGQQYAALYDLDAIRRGVYDDPRVYPSDIVVVGDSPARRMFSEILKITPLITTPLVTLIAYRR